ncbi:MAG: exonuclease SbcCD subunit D [Micrococcaceae bacterium]
MKFLHTSDWHLGRTFHKNSTQEAQEKFCQRIIDLALESNIDVVLIAGDIYDSAQPPLESIKLYEKTISGILEAGAKVFMISGNHDNRIRLGTLRQIMEGTGCSIRTAIPEDISKPLILEDEHGPIAVYGIPYIKPVNDQEKLKLGGTTVNPITATKAATDLVRQNLEERGNPRSIVLAHAFVSGGKISDSEKHTPVGGIDNVPSELFEDFSYTALGHLHGQQLITDTIRYSGSPMPYSFSEAEQTKGFWIFDMNKDGLGKVYSIAHTDYRQLAKISGSLEELLNDSKYDDAEDKWCQVTLVQEEAPKGAYDQLKKRFPFIADYNQDIEADKRIFIAPEVGNTQTENPAEVMKEFVKFVQSRQVDDLEQEFIQEAVEKAQRRQEA